MYEVGLLSNCYILLMWLIFICIGTPWALRPQYLQCRIISHYLSLPFPTLYSSTYWQGAANRYELISASSNYSCYYFYILYSIHLFCISILWNVSYTIVCSTHCFACLCCYYYLSIEDGCYWLFYIYFYAYYLSLFGFFCCLHVKFFWFLNMSNSDDSI